MAAGLLLAALSLGGCGTLSPAKPVQGIESIAGRWEGNLTVQASEYGTTTSGATWIIHENGTYEMITKKWRAKGRVRVYDGKILFSDGPRGSGIASLHEGPEGRVLVSAGDEPGSFGSWRPAR